MVLAATIMGGIHPLLYLFVTALIALVAWIPYMYVMAKVRKWAGYKNYKGIVMSYILLSLSNIGSPLYVWVFSDYADISSDASEMA